MSKKLAHDAELVVRRALRAAMRSAGGSLLLPYKQEAPLCSVCPSMFSMLNYTVRGINCTLHALPCPQRALTSSVHSRCQRR